jgi:hypothetical protein
MAALSNLIPMRWPSGPLEIARRQKTEGYTAQNAQVLDFWHRPAALDILQGSAVNCLVVSWAAGLPEDAEQQRTIRPLVEAARARNLAVVGWVDGASSGQAAIAPAQSAGLAAVAMQGFTGKSDFTVIPWGDRAHAPWNTTAPVLPITDNVWPGAAAGRRNDPTAGPTGVPWLDSNGWYIQLARARTQSPVWVLFDPPGKGTVVQPQSYLLAVCDAEAAGGRWVISLDDGVRAELAGKGAGANAAWRAVSEAVSFFEKRREWKTYQPLGVVGVLSDFSGENYDFSGEILNLMARRDVPFRVLWNTGAGTPALTGLRALVSADGTQPAAPLRKSILSFVEQGGLLVTGPKWGSEGTPGAAAHARFEVRALGKGRIAVAKQDLGDPYELVMDTQALLSYSNEIAKLFNASASGGFHYTASPDGKRALLQLLTYATAGRAANLTTAWTRRKYRSAKVWTIDAAQPAPVQQAECEDGGTEYHLPPMPAYAALDLEV